MTSNKNDLIIDEGFPALNTFVPEDSKNEKDSLPRYPFASFPSAVSVDETQMENIIHDCELAFTARTKEDSEAYSSGATFFIPSHMKPRCALEQLASDIFKTHTKGLEPGKHFDPDRSGSEWWLLVLDSNSSSMDDDKNDKDRSSSDEEDDEDDEVGMHFDADYGLEDQLPNYLLHPRVATVTYLSNVGVPTLVLDKNSPPPTDVEKKSLNGDIEKGWLSFPVIGKHICFDGRLLHGAPGTFFPAMNNVPNRNSEDESEQHSSKRRKLEGGEKTEALTNEPQSSKRITFMVNVWLNHCPIDAELFDDGLCYKMKINYEISKDEKASSNLKGDADYKPALQWELSDVSKSSHKTLDKKLQFCEDELKRAGTDECVICNREVDVKYNSTMEDLHSATKEANDAIGKSLAFEFEPKVIQLTVGAEVEDSDDDEDEAEE